MNIKTKVRLGGMAPALKAADASKIRPSGTGG